jgi:ABC-type Fe3+/spermidine/putrescine transport system ATPase subunit
MTRVNLRNLCKTYEGADTPAVKNLTLDVEAGELVALLGPSGCGKTTTLKMIAGLLEPTRGDVVFDEELVTAVKPEKREAVMVFQNYLLFPYMTVGENVGFGLKMRRFAKNDINRQVKEMLALVKLEGFEHRRPAQLSGGQMQRVALARALILSPRVLLLDEPLSNLDAHLRDEMRDLIQTLQRQFGLTTIFVTHDQEEAVLLADRIALMFEGQLQQFSTPAEFYEHPSTRRVASFFGNSNFLTGTKKNNVIYTPAGEFATTHTLIPDGPVTMIIRPEAIELGCKGDNSIKALVKRQVYMGTYTRYRIALDHTEWEVFGEPNSGVNLEGSYKEFTLPKEKIWLLADN